jgi:hypothetical protein
MLVLPMFKSASSQSSPIRLSSSREMALCGGVSLRFSCLLLVPQPERKMVWTGTVNATFIGAFSRPGGLIRQVLSLLTKFAIFRHFRGHHQGHDGCLTRHQLQHGTCQWFPLVRYQRHGVYNRESDSLSR